MRQVEQLETRRLLTAFTATSVAELVGDINAANAAGGANTITLTPATTFNLTVADNEFGTPTGLPVIAAANDLTIVGNADTIQRSTATGTPAFRLFAVATGSSLTLNNLTLSNGLSFHPTSGIWGEGGGIANEGTLSLSRVTVQNCVAKGQERYPAFGGGIYSSGTLAVVDSAIVNNQALGSNGSEYWAFSKSGNTGEGGGLFVAGGTASLTNTTVSSNLARGGDGVKAGVVSNPDFSFQWAGGNGGDAFGGGIYAYANTTLTLRGTTVSRNTAQGGAGGRAYKKLPQGANGAGQGGGIYVAAPALVGLDSFTQAHTSGNTASTRDNDIFGSFTILA
jgi:hypothetical protein